MRLMTVEHITDAYQTLRRSRARTVLTALGIAIGVASVTCILAISDGARGMISNQVNTYDGKLMIVRPSAQTRDLNAYLNPTRQQLFGTSSLTEADIEAAKSIDGIDAVVPLMILNATAKTSRAEAANNVVLSTTPAFIKTADIKMNAGQFLGEETDDSAVVIGNELHGFCHKAYLKAVQFKNIFNYISYLQVIVCSLHFFAIFPIYFKLFHYMIVFTRTAEFGFYTSDFFMSHPTQIGRASCRERV